MPGESETESPLDYLKKRDLRRRFDDTYKTLLVIGPVLSYSLTNFSDSDVTENFVRNIGYQYLILSVLLWALPNLFAGRTQYLFKMAGFVIIVYVFLIITFIVFDRGRFYSPLWYILVVLVSMVITHQAGKLLIEDGVLAQRDNWIMVVFSLILGVITIPLVFLWP
jgi:hypothetical protein